MKKLKMLKNKKGFTLIELLTVIAIFGILVLIAAPKFLGYTAKANVSHIKADVKTYETRLAVDELENKNLSKDWTIVAPEDVDKYISEKSLYDEYGLVKDPTKIEGEVKLLDKKDVDVKTNLKGDFLYANGEVYYHDETLTMGNDKNDSVNNNDEDENTVNNNDEDENTVVDNNDEDENTVVEEPEFTSEDNFKWVRYSEGYYSEEYPTQIGYYRYTGTGEEIVNIPHVIKGTKMTSYRSMFRDTGEDVKKVISTNPNVTDMKYMFSQNKATTLDLSKFDTSSVTDMNCMFYQNKTTTLDLSNWDTSNVTNMGQMFYLSQAKSLDLSSFDTSNVTNMNSMFHNSQATTLDVSSFDTSNVTSMNRMFRDSQATTLNLIKFNTSKVTDMDSMFFKSQAESLDLRSFDTSNVPTMHQMFYGTQATTGYARTQADADRFNASSYKSSNLTFITK